jgi:hypothetical protein
MASVSSPLTTTWAPWRASFRAIASPMPAPPPVTIATLSSQRPTARRYPRPWAGKLRRVSHARDRLDEGDGDQWPTLHERILAAQILVIATPTWLGRPSSIAQRVLERMDAMISEGDDRGRRSPTTAWPGWW